jgi:hypothetical protein
MSALKGGLAMTLQRMVCSTSIGALMTLRAGPALADCHTPPTTSSTTEMTEDFPTPVRPLYQQSVARTEVPAQRHQD